MPLAAGTRIGAYEIVSELGSGGPTLARHAVPRELRWVHYSHDRTAP